MAEIVDDLAGLTGEELYYLFRQLDKWLAGIEAAGRKIRRNDRRLQPLNRAWADINDMRDAVLLQLARITVPMREAQQIIYRARFARGHPVRMNPGA